MESVAHKLTSKTYIMYITYLIEFMFWICPWSKKVRIKSRLRNVKTAPYKVTVVIPGILQLSMQFTSEIYRTCLQFIFKHLRADQFTQMIPWIYNNTKSTFCLSVFRVFNICCCCYYMTWKIPLSFVNQPQKIFRIKYFRRIARFIPL